MNPPTDLPNSTLTQPAHDPWLDPALRGSRPILYDRSDAEKAANAALIQEQVRDLRWARRSTKTATALFGFVGGLLVGVIVAVSMFAVATR